MYRSRRRTGRSKLRSVDQDSLSSSNLDALLSFSNANTRIFLSNNYNSKNIGEDIEEDEFEKNFDKNFVKFFDKDFEKKIEKNRGPGSEFFDSKILESGGAGAGSSSTGPLSEAARRANLMHNMRRQERIEMLKNKRKEEKNA
jgi:hypothetical protein